MFDRDIMVLSLYRLKTEGSMKFELNINELVVVSMLTMLVLLIYKLLKNSEYEKNLRILMNQESMLRSKQFIILSKDLIHTMDYVDTAL